MILLIKYINNMDKLKIIDTIIEHYPILKKERNNIINIVFEKIEDKNKYIFDKITVGDKHYYKDRYNILFDSNLNIVGIIQIKSDNKEKIIIRDRTNRKNIYNSFLQQQDLNMRKNKV
jgi:hypothetical protein